jgi:hypothetical protein
MTNDLPEIPQLTPTPDNDAATVNITGIGLFGTGLIMFKGFLTNNNAPVELLHHVSQVNFLLILLKRENPQ